jgi:hypothetical protein
LQRVVPRVDALEELIQNNALEAAILSGTESLGERDIMALRGMWRARNKVRREEEELAERRR